MYHEENTESGSVKGGCAKMNTYWSQYVQKTEELYLSRGLRFHKGNIDRWIEAMGLRDGMKLLEVGCAGGS